MEWPLGVKVTVRRREADGLYDAVGELIEKSPDYVVVRTRTKGDVKVPATKMVKGKIVPPPRPLRRIIVERDALDRDASPTD